MVTSIGWERLDLNRSVLDCRRPVLRGHRGQRWLPTSGTEIASRSCRGTDREVGRRGVMRDPLLGTARLREYRRRNVEFATSTVANSTKFRVPSGVSGGE